MQVFALGFREFLDSEKISEGATCLWNLSQFSSATVPIAISWSAILVENADCPLSIFGFVGGKNGQEISLKCGKVKCAHLGEAELCVVDESCSIKLFDISGAASLPRENANQTLTSVHKWKEVDRFGNGGDLYATTVKGELYSLNNWVPTWIPLPLKVTKMSCGISHGVILADNGTVYSWGSGSRGQLGHGCLQDEAKPKLVDILCGVSIKSISAGGWHSIALAETGDIYVWGWNEGGQLGFPANDSSLHHYKTEVEDSSIVAMLHHPTLLELEKHLECSGYITIADISCGSRHSAAITKDGRAVTWGWGKYGQLGHSCCQSLSLTGEENSIEVEGAKRRKTDSTLLNSKFCPCGSRPHLPGYVSNVNSRMLHVTSVKCGHWNTFFTARDGVSSTE